MSQYITNEQQKQVNDSLIDIANSSKSIYIKGKRNKNEPLFKLYDDKNSFEMGIDEAGRGPLFGRLYVAGVIIPKNSNTFRYYDIKDSKRFTSKKKLLDIYNHIIEECIDYYVSYQDETQIDTYNIRQCVLTSMNECITNISTKPDFVMIDGNDFVNKTNDSDLNYVCIEGGDNWYVSIAAASIIAKVERDKYIEEMCLKEPELDLKYGLLSNKGYGTKKHIDGIKQYGISTYHRKSYGICKSYSQ
tara:strand:+ start:769 stop:1506 length:738 start_codon:yes stop_codon:yes gene_type:complete